jgi:hypothetical protein
MRAIAMSDFGTCERRHTIDTRCGKPAVGEHKLCEECRLETKAGVEANLVRLRQEIESQRAILRALL